MYLFPGTGEFNDVYTFASVLYRDGQYRRSVHVLEREQLVAVRKDAKSCRNFLLCVTCMCKFHNVLVAGCQDGAVMSYCHVAISAQQHYNKLRI